jgi:hypothetical protein
MVRGKPSTGLARQMDAFPPLDLLVLLYTCTDVWRYVLQGGREYGHVVALQGYFPHKMCVWSTVACGGPDP